MPSETIQATTTIARICNPCQLKFNPIRMEMPSETIQTTPESEIVNTRIVNFPIELVFKG